ncbi:MAG: clostripain-related cysteine peptidase [Candidatus Cloacimonadota bacterium]|nr:clostripain-related cysteine peptidase [Candidatus Cloacimonadota bacterium]
MKKNIFILLLLISIVFGCDLLFQEKSEWTVLVYMAADNGLNQSAINDIIQMEKAHISDDVKVVVQIDFNENESGMTGYEGTTRYLISKNNYDEIGSEVLMELGDINSGKLESLVDFVNWGLDKYPSERNSLIIWSHATGWRNNEKYIGIDGGETISVSQGELHNAFAQFEKNIDILAFDACNMQSIEVVAEVEEFTDYVIGSEDGIPTSGFPYHNIFDDWNPTYSTLEICDIISSKFYDSYLPGGSQNPQDINYNISFSVVNANKYKQFFDRLDLFAEKWLQQDDFSQFIEARQSCYEFNDMQMDIDALNYFTELKDVADNNIDLAIDCNEIIENIDELCPKQYSFNYPDFVGTFSICFPKTTEEYDSISSIYNGLIYSDSMFYQLIQEIITHN